MLRLDNKEEKLPYEFINIEEMVPQDHLLRKIDRYIDFSFINKAAKDLYCEDNGRPAIEPIVLFKMLFLKALYGIRSEKELVRQIQVNVAYRWFLGFSLRDKIPDDSTLSQNRRRRFNGTTIYQEIFDQIVQQAIDVGLVSGKILYSDSTHLKANANKKKFIIKGVRKEPKGYVKELEYNINQDRINHGKEPLKKKTLILN